MIGYPVMIKQGCVSWVHIVLLRILYTTDVNGHQQLIMTMMMMRK